jgi:hypothetical protein
MAANLPMSAARLKFIHFHYAQPSAAAFFPFFSHSPRALSALFLAGAQTNSN